MWLVLILVICLPSEAYAARVLIDKQTGKAVNAFQSDPQPGVLLQNYLNNPGVGSAENYEEQEVSEKEWKRLEEEVNGAERRRLAVEQVAAEATKGEERDIPVGEFGAGLAGILTGAGILAIRGRKKKEGTP